MHIRRPLVGATLLERYRVLRPLGQGGMGAVYEAADVKTGAVVAIKVLARPKSNNAAREYRRFIREAQTAARLAHSHAVQVFAVGELDSGEPFFVMERLLGETLRARLDRVRQIKFGNVVTIFNQLLAVLESVHAQGIIHRDVKPENIFLTERPGEAPMAKLIDFGVAKLWQGKEESDDHGGQTSLTATGVVVGTVAYLSPEQISNPRELDPLIDLWACGVTLYESLTGRRPFQGETPMAIMLDVLHRSPAAARRIRPSIPGALEVVVMTSLRRRPEHRYPSAAHFRAALMTAGASLIERRPPSSPDTQPEIATYSRRSSPPSASTSENCRVVHTLPADVAELLTQDTLDDDDDGGPTRPF